MWVASGFSDCASLAHRRTEQDVEQIDVLLTRHTEDVFHPFVLQTLDDKFRSFHHSFTFRSLKALLMTETELRLMAAPAIMGLSSQPKKG